MLFLLDQNYGMNSLLQNPGTDFPGGLWRLHDTPIKKSLNTSSVVLGENPPPLPGATKELELQNYLGVFSPGLCFLLGRRETGFEEILDVLLPPQWVNRSHLHCQLCWPGQCPAPLSEVLGSRYSSSMASPNTSQDPVVAWPWCSPICLGSMSQPGSVGLLQMPSLDFSVYHRIQGFPPEQTQVRTMEVVQEGLVEGLSGSRFSPSGSARLPQSVVVLWPWV